MNTDALQGKGWVLGPSGPPAQADRIAELMTPLGRDVLVLVHFEGTEALSGSFEYVIEALSERDNIDFDAAIGRNCRVTFHSYDGVDRVFNGVLVDAAWTGPRAQAYGYHLVLRPWTWLLGKTANCRIFNEKNVLDIIEEVFREAGFKDYEIRANRGDYDKIEYCVQYRETDLAFVSRLMEEWGIYTFFEHSEERHLLVLGDSRSCHRAVKAGGGTIPFIALVDRDRREREHLGAWHANRRFRTGKFATNDYDYMKPTADLKADAQGSARYEKGSLEDYNPPGRYLERDLGRRRSRVRLEAEQAADGRKWASGDAPSLYPGALLTMRGHRTDDGEYLVVGARHVIATEFYRTSGSGSGGRDEVYRGTYDLLPTKTPYRAPLATPHPRVHGPQTAFVVTRKGKEGEEIDVDEEGRIFVQFHWNRDKDRISRPVRVSQGWSGKSWGWQVIPRVGQEVVVEFLEGDPDQPLVVGTVYNKDYPYPYKLPDNKTISGVKSDSSKGHGGFNAFTFEDKKSSEKVYLRAEKDLESLVRHAETREIGESFETPVGSPSRKTTLKHGDDNLKLDTGSWNVDVAQEIDISAFVKITIRVGGNKIVLDQSGITISGLMIKVQGVSIEQNAAVIKLNC